MAALYRHAHRSRGHKYGFVENLVSLVHHLHLFLRVSVLQEGIYMRQYIFVYRVRVYCRIFTPFLSGTLGFHLVQGLVAGPCHRLICGNHYPFYPESLVQRGQRHKHLDGGAVRIGYDIVICRNHVSVYFRHYKLFRRIHPPA